MKRWFLTLLTAAGLTCPLSAGAAADVSFTFPLACTLGENCWVLNYVDMGAPGDGREVDPFCGPRTYEGNKGTSFALRDVKAMESGIAVLAARAGKVIRVRDGEPDRFAGPAELEAAKTAQKECGNAVLIDHGGAVQTVYCHLKSGSVTVKTGDSVKAGDPIAAVGLSGYTAFPKLHFGVVWEGAVIDPFTGLNSTEACGTVKKSLWQDGGIPSVPAPSFYNAGFAAAVPTIDEADRAALSATEFAAASGTLSFWTSLIGVLPGDTIVLEMAAPDGSVFARRVITQNDAPARQFYYTGRKLSGGALKTGTYTGRATLIRAAADGSERRWTAERTATVD